MKRVFWLMVPISILHFNFISGYGYAESTLNLQKLCSDEAKKAASEITAEHTWECHYNKEHDKCFVIVRHLKGTITLTNVFENRIIGLFGEDATPCRVENKKCTSLKEFEALIKPYMEE